MHWFILPFRRYAEFSGRSRRREYWCFQLLNLVVTFALIAPILASLMSIVATSGEMGSFSSRSQSYVQLADASAAVGKRKCEPFCSSPAPDAPIGPAQNVFNDSSFDDGGLGDDALTELLVGSTSIFLLAIWWLATFIPNLAVTVRRLHDVGFSGWYLLLYYGLTMLPFVGGIVAIIFLVVMFMPGQKGDNRYGGDPKSADNYEMVFA
ncbi:MAG: DUF805 domain-containing protein [Pseudomonadota bacterium]